MNETPFPVLEPAWQYGRSRPRRTRRLIVVCVLIIAVILLWALRPVWLTSIATFLNRSSTPTMSDAIVLLGGGRGHRCEYASALHQAGYAPTIVVMGDSVGEGRCCSQREYIEEMLYQLGVSPAAVFLAAPSTSTHEEALNARVALEELGAQSAIVVTDPFHTRRAQATFRKVWEGSGIAVRFSAADPSWFEVDGWWTRERELLAVFEEYLKLTYYLLSGKI